MQKQGHPEKAAWQNRITDLLGVRYPLLQGPMRLISLGEMAACVSSAGGFGQIAASGLDASQLKEEIAKAREITDRPFGVNIPIYRPNAMENLEAAIDSGVKAITTSAGNPAKATPQTREGGVVLLHKVSSLAQAMKAQKAGVDGVIAMGFEAGGHVGKSGVSTMCLVRELCEYLDIPVVAAGGIADTRSVIAAFALGAQGVEMGTRFAASVECPLPDEVKKRMTAASCEATTVLGKDVMPVRVLQNRLTSEVEKMVAADADRDIENQGDEAYAGASSNPSSRVMPCGQVTGLVRELCTIEKIIGDITRGATEVVNQLSGFVGGKE